VGHLIIKTTALYSHQLKIKHSLISDLIRILILWYWYSYW